jgi:hypothetical protein
VRFASSLLIQLSRRAYGAASECRRVCSRRGLLEMKRVSLRRCEGIPALTCTWQSEMPGAAWCKVAVEVV